MYVEKTDVIRDSVFFGYILHVMFGAFGVLAIAYVVILGNMIFNINERKSLEKEVSTLSSEVGELELEYLALSKKVDLGLSRTLGFKEAKPAFAARKSLGFDTSNLTTEPDNEI